MVMPVLTAIHEVQWFHFIFVFSIIWLLSSIPLIIFLIFRKPNKEWFEEGIDYLEKFILREGHCRVPNSYKEGDYDLGFWISSMRTNYKKGVLSQVRIKILESYKDKGWLWDRNEIE